ncbi:hypothetical protein LPJ61_001707 [Coemansia biformis]|uniref:Pre-mRNA-splicing factor n=1 Tax=Coemansia biformis TaxID=1286918 RepID=A0A9W7YGD2_9FUNG|nr:hypothetical protein LPJ61_001707 [Coemansia biformis]
MPPKSRVRGGRGGRKAGAGATSKRPIPTRSTVSKDTRAAANATSDGTPRTNSGDQGSDDLATIAGTHWMGRKPKWSEDVVRRIMADHIVGAKSLRANLQLLERTQYLELYLWPHYSASGASEAMVVSVLLMLNEKFQQRLHASAWAVVCSDPAKFARLFDDAVDLMRKLMKGGDLEFIDSMSARSVVTQFLVGCFSSIETRQVRDCVMPLVSLSIWHHVEGQTMMEREFAKVPQLRKFWKHLNKKGKGDGDEAVRSRINRDFVPELVKDFIGCQYAAADNWGALAYGVKMLELLVDMESQLPTRRYVNLLLVDFQIVSLCERSPWNQLQGTSDGQASLVRRFKELTARLCDMVHFQVDDVAGHALTDAEAKDAHYQQLADLQLAAFEHFPRELEDVAVSSVARLGDRDVLTQCLATLDRPSLLKMAKVVGIRHRSVMPTGVSADLVDPDGSYSEKFLLAVFAERYGKRPTVADQVRAVSPFPTEQLLFSDAVCDADGYERQPHVVTFGAQGTATGDGRETACISYPVLAVPKLNMQFLTLHDYLARCFELLRLESAYEIREDVEDAARRLQPRMTYEPADGGHASVTNTHFDGWTRMALPMRSFEVTDVQRPRIGEAAPSKVRADISVDLRDYVESIRREWDEEVRPRDVLILCSVQAHNSTGPSDGCARKCIRSVRGCEIECRLDSKGRPIGDGATGGADVDGEESLGPKAGSLRYFRVLLDRHQYHADIQARNDTYETLNVVMRRKPQENNFKSVLETIRELMVNPVALPDWLSATFLGYGDPGTSDAVQWTRAGKVWFGDTFVSEEHLRECLGQFTVEFANECGFAKPCAIEFLPRASEGDDSSGVVRVTHETVASMGPIELGARLENKIRFTPAQVAAIGSAAREGLTLIVGPPGTGKTDVAVQIVSNLYHAYPRQKILIITHSNQALNQLFEKIIALDIEPRHLLRLGHGEGDLDAEESYSRAGRVDSYLERRTALLQDVRDLAESMGIAGGDVGYTCDNARFFYVVHVRLRWEAFRRKTLEGGNVAEQAIRSGFPFAKYFESRLGRPLFASNCSIGEMIETAEGCFRWLERMFDELADIQPFELLRSRAERANYLLTNQARIVAMTCTHAALKRGDLVRLGFRYDTVVMEEAAQVLDIETLIPLTLHRAGGDGAGRELKRLVMIGDHNQLPPVVRNSGLRAFANMEQSLFTRLVRLGVPYIELNRQARARPQIASLYRFRYRDLGDLLPAVEQGPFAQPNPGFANEFQFIDVANFGGKGESEPTRYFFQSLGEAEYMVAMYQYMRLLGYPAERIALLTTYNDRLAICTGESFGMTVGDQRATTVVDGVEVLGDVVYKMIEAHLARNELPADEPAGGESEEDQAMGSESDEDQAVDAESGEEQAVDAEAHDDTGG